MYDQERLDGIFECIVRSYIETAQPVGSRVISERYQGQLSPASIRSVMADLEERGLLTHPHTSAGRVPTDRGFRYYVDSLIDWNDVEIEDEKERQDVSSLLKDYSNIEDAMEMLSHHLAELTQNVALVLINRVKRVSYVWDVPTKTAAGEPNVSMDARIYMDGAGYLLDQPEFNDAMRVKEMIKILERKESLKNLLSRSSEDSKVRIHIGDEVESDELSNLSMISKTYSFGDVPIGSMAVIGPTRMHYGKTVNAVSRIADEFTDFLNSF